MTDFNNDSYRTGYFVGRIMGSMMQGCRDMAGSWPADAPPEARKEIEEFAAFQGLAVTFDANGFSVTERKKPKLEVVN